MTPVSYFCSVFLFLCFCTFSSHVFAQQVNFQKPVEIQLTPYKTTLYADGKDNALIKVKIIDKKGDEVFNSKKIVAFHISGDGFIKSVKGTGVQILFHSDTLWSASIIGDCDIIFIAGKSKSIIHFEASADSLYKGSTDFQTLFHETAHKVTNGVYLPKKVNDKILGADISFLPELESKGMKFKDKGTQKDVLTILKEHGFNYIRLRIFNDPANTNGYSPELGFCDLEHTKQMAKRIKAAGLKFLLDFHYSDYWADPGHEYKPAAWQGQDFKTLETSLYTYTLHVMQQLKEQGTLPDMVQVGNEINHGMVWPEGMISNLDSLAALIYEGFKAIKEVNPATPVILHIALGGQNAESRFFLDNMKKRNVPFDIIGLSYYPKWHGTLSDLKNNMTDLANRYHKQVMVAEYSFLKKEVNDIAFSFPNHMALGTFIWEPLSTWEMFFDRKGNTNELINVYPLIAKKYHIGKY